MANFTEREIKRSFIKLLNEKPLSKISVRDIVEDCGINRNSFYYHFQDIPALLEEIVSEQSAAIIQKYPQPDSLEECFRAAFEFALSNKRAAYNSSTPLTATCLTASCFGCVTKRFPHI